MTENRVDVHQHVWTEPLLTALDGRERVISAAPSPAHAVAA
jgi:hypothetical protein